MANIRDVAKLANVSIASVSRILNNDATYKATELTRQNVLEAARRLDYTPPAAYSKKRQRAENAAPTIACITNLTSERYKDSYFMSILAGVKKQLARLHYELDFTQSQYDITDPEHVSNLFKKNTKGVILMSTPSEEAFKVIKSKTKCIVGVDTTIEEIDNVRYNRFEAGCIAMQHLFDNGHKKIAYIGSHIPHKYSVAVGRYDAYSIMMGRMGYEILPEWVVDCRWERQVCFEKTRALIKSENPPTAIFVASDHMAIAAMSALFQENVQIPEDVSIVSISDIPEAKYLNPPLTTVAIPQQEMGEIVANTIVQRIESDRSVPKQIYVPTKLIKRNSVREL